MSSLTVYLHYSYVIILVSLLASTSTLVHYRCRAVLNETVMTSEHLHHPPHVTRSTPLHGTLSHQSSPPRPPSRGPLSSSALPLKTPRNRRKQVAAAARSEHSPACLFPPTCSISPSPLPERKKSSHSWWFLLPSSVLDLSVVCFPASLPLPRWPPSVSSKSSAAASFSHLPAVLLLLPMATKRGNARGVPVGVLLVAALLLCSLAPASASSYPASE